VLWVKTFHLFFAVAWFAGLLYLPRLFVYHAQCGDAPGRARFEVMERKLLWAIMTPSMAATLALGLWLVAYGHRGGWIVAKTLLALALVGYQAACWMHMRRLAAGRETLGHVYFRCFNEIPAVILLGLLWLVVHKPF